MTRQRRAPSLGRKAHPRGPDEPIQDQGWSWVVLAAATVGCVLASLIYTTGFYNIIFLDVFHMNKQATAWIGSMPGSLMALCGPVSSAMTNKLGPRATVIIGGLVGSTGYLLTVFANDFYHVFITFGVITGIGFGVCYVPCIVIVGYYFDKYRNLAFGIANTAFGLGTVILPFLVKVSVEAYSWKGSMYIMAGVFLHMCVCGAVFKPVPRAREERVGQELRSPPDRGLFGSSMALEVSASMDRGLNYAPASRDSLTLSRCSIHKAASLGGSSTKPADANGKYDTLSQGISRDFSREGDRKCSVALSKNTLTLLMDKRFHLVSVSLIVMHAGNFIPFVHFPAYAMENGATVAQATTLVSVIGICSIISRLTGGAVTNHKRVRVTPVYLFSCGCCALMFFFSPIMLRAYPGQLAFAACFGFWGNWCNALLAPLTVELFSMEQLSTAFGIECLMCGIGILIGPPLAGYIYDATGTYANGFYAAGGLYAVGLLLMLAIPLEAKITQMRQDRLEKQQARAEALASDSIEGIIEQNTV